MPAGPSICIIGAGNIGCYVGGMLASAGRDVSFLARAKAIEEIKAVGLHLTSFDGFQSTVEANQVTLSTDASILTRANIILVAVKGRDTVAVAETIARYAPQELRPDVRIVSLQNGIGNVPALRQGLEGLVVLGGMVPFNVMVPKPGRYHRATSGDIVIEADALGTALQLSVTGLKVRTTRDIERVQWGKVLINLNNALNALSNQPLRDQLSQRSWRHLFAQLIEEALAVMKAEGIRPQPPTPLPAALLPRVLRLPDALFQRIAARMINIDPLARSSMWDDLERHRLTEIDDLQGVIIARAAKHQVSVPLNRRVHALIKAAEAANAGAPGLSPETIVKCS
jgi:2-dehydropantoate 2-reductase